MSLVGLAGLSLSALLAQAVVQGELSCPEPAAVERELRALLKPGAVFEETVRLSPTEGGFVLELRGTDGSLIDVRELEASGTCAEQARTAGVVLSIWIGQIHPRILLAPPPLPAEPEAEVRSGPEPDSPPGAGGDEPVSGATPMRLDVGAGLLASVADGGARIGIAAQVQLMPSESGFGGHLGFYADLGRSVSFDPEDQGGVTFDWNRFPLTVGPAARLAFEAWALEARAVAAPTLVWARGRSGASGAVDASADTDWALGAGGGLRAVTRDGMVPKWVDVSGLAWFGRDLGVVSAADAASSGLGQVALPSFQLFVSVGAAWCPACASGG